MAYSIIKIEGYLFPKHRNRSRRSFWRYAKRTRNKKIRRSVRKALYDKDESLIIPDKKYENWEY